MRKLLLAILVVTLVSNVFAADPGEYASRRARLAKDLGAKAMLILLSPRPALRNGDVTWPFRQSDDLLYLTGIAEPETTLVMLPGETEFAEVVFVRESNPRAELYTGRVPSRDEITKISGIKRVEPASGWRNFAGAILGGARWGRPEPGAAPHRAAASFYKAVLAGEAEIWLTHVSRGTAMQALSEEQQFANDMRQRYPELRFRDAQPLIRSMRMVKSPSEIAAIQRAIDITTAAQKAAMKRVLTAANEGQVDAVIDFTYRDLGAPSWGFPSIVASGVNATTLHYEKNDAPIDRNGLMLTDLGAEFEGYSADVTRTYPANGKFNPEQRAIYEAVLAAQDAGIAAARPGAAFYDVERAAIASFGRDLLKLGLITKDDPKQVALYFRHGVGHLLGLDVHDVTDLERKIEPNMVFTVEPGIYVRRDDIISSPAFTSLPKEDQERIRAAVDKFNGIGVRIEDDVVATDGAARILSAAAPRSVAGIEAFMAAAP